MGVLAVLAVTQPVQEMAAQAVTAAQAVLELTVRMDLKRALRGQTDLSEAQVVLEVPEEAQEWAELTAAEETVVTVAPEGQVATVPRGVPVLTEPTGQL